MSTNNPLTTSNDSIWEAIDWHPSSNQLEELIKLQSLLLTWNQKINLTRLLEGNDYWVTQVIDSLWPFRKKLQNPPAYSKYIDVGSGCGFPGLAIAIALPNAEMLLVDSNKKKTTILESIVKDLHLENRISVINERIELTGQNNFYRGQFDLAIARAVADAPVTAEYLIPLIKQKGQAFLLKGKWTAIDRQNLEKAALKLNAKIKRIEYFNLPEKKGERHLIVLAPESTCPEQYPRKIGTPKKKPLFY